MAQYLLALGLLIGSSTLVGGDVYDFFSDNSVQKYVSNGYCFNDALYIPENLISVKDFFSEKTVDDDWVATGSGNSIEGEVADGYLGIEAGNPGVGKVIVASSCGDGCVLREDALLAFGKMVDDFHGLFSKKLTVNSAYRSYANQEAVRKQYISSHGIWYANNYVAFPGASEHQTALVLDLLVSVLNAEEFGWLKGNSHLYGFHFSYQKGADVDGYNIEDWHIRYLGVDFATLLYKEGKTFSEYMRYSKHHPSISAEGFCEMENTGKSLLFLQDFLKHQLGRYFEW